MNEYYQEAIGSQTGMLGSSQSSKNDNDKDIKIDSDKNDSIKPKSSKEIENKAGGKESINNIKTNTV